MNLFESEPLVIIGCHRSGTTLLSQLLERSGVFQGKNRDENNESFFFMDINQWIMRRAGGNWDWPEPTRLMLRDPKSREAIIEHVRAYTMRRIHPRFFGRNRFLNGTASGPSMPIWGWKDPRTTVTAEIWRSIFPQAKFIYVSRHGVDVAASLMKRATTKRTLAKRFSGQLGQWMRPKLGRCELADSPRATSLEGAFNIWREYSRTASNLMDKVGESGITVAYEQLLEDPHEQVARISRLCANQPLDPATSGTLDRSRSMAYRRDPELDRFANSKAKELSEFGYDA